MSLTENLWSESADIISGMYNAISEENSNSLAAARGTCDSMVALGGAFFLTAFCVTATSTLISLTVAATSVTGVLDCGMFAYNSGKFAYKSCKRIPTAALRR